MPKGFWGLGFGGVGKVCEKSFFYIGKNIKENI
jgi:hypothetical protein